MRRDLKEQVYDWLVNRKPEIAKRYQAYAENLSGVGRLKAWLYLLGLNICFSLPGKHRRKNRDNEEYKKLYLKGSESSLSYRENPVDFARRLAVYDVVCFDVFDTLILRPFSRPEDLFSFVGNELGYLNFRKIRKKIEHQARRKKMAERGNSEVTFAEIWSEMERETGIPAQKGMKAEWDCERRYCFANPYMLEVVRALRDEGVKMSIVSDMYLGEDRIRSLLEHCGYGKFETYFVSCDYGKSKNDGNLYETVRNVYGNSARIIQVGDNIFSDINQAQKYGFDAEYYKNVNDAGRQWRTEEMSEITGTVYRGVVNSWIHNGLKLYSQSYEFGFIYGGIFCMGYCRWIHDYVKNNGIEKILFLSRDGYILNRLYQFLYPGDREKCEYVYWSRRAAVKMASGYFRYDYFRRFLFHKVNQGYTLEKIFSDRVSGGKYKATSELGKEAAHSIQKYLESNWEQTEAHYKNQTEGAGIYYKAILKGCTKAVAVDSGWAGSGAVSLNYLVNQVWGIDCEITGMLAGTNSACSQEPGASEGMLYCGKLKSYVFSQNHNRNIWKSHNPNRGDNVVVELLLSAEEGSLRGFTSEGMPEFLNPDETADIKEIHKGIMDYASWYVKCMGNITDISGSDAFAPLLLVMKNREWFQKIRGNDRIQMNLD